MDYTKELTECLIMMCEQYLVKGLDLDGWLEHSFMCAGENSLALLDRMGLVETEDGVTYKLLKR